MALEHDSKTGLALAVRTAGSQAAFGRLIGKRQSVVNDWLRLDKELPAELVALVQLELGIPRHELRPDLFGDENPSPAQHSVGQPPDGCNSVRSTGGPDSDPIEGLAA